MLVKLDLFSLDYVIVVDEGLPSFGLVVDVAQRLQLIAARGGAVPHPGTLPEHPAELVFSLQHATIIIGSSDDRIADRQQYEWLIDRKSSDGQVEAAAGEAFVGQDNFDVVLLRLAIFLGLLLPLLGREELQFIVLQFLLQSFQFYLVLEDGFLVVVDLFSHRLDLFLLLLQRLLVGRNHAFLLH